MTDNQLLIGASAQNRVFQSGRMSNRHGLVAGATGTGKTVTLQRLCEEFSRQGVPVFAADVKGDLSGLAAPGNGPDFVRERLRELQLTEQGNSGNPTVFWELTGQRGHPIRVTVSEIGPLLLSTLLELNDTQTGVLYAVFRIADDEGLLLLDLKDLQSMLNWVGANGRSLGAEYGQLPAASLAAIRRRLLVLEEQGAERFFGEPALRIEDLMQTDFSGHGVISLLDASQLVHQSPKLYACLLLWLLSELFESLPERGDQDWPRLAIFFDEAHLLFDGAPRALLDKIEQVVRLIRSKGVGLYFVSQSPLDLPEDVLGQLGLRIQHAMRAFTPRDRQSIRAIAAGFRASETLDTEATITTLGIGEALVSTLDDRGMPSPVALTRIAPPRSRIGALSDAERRQRIERSPLKGRYEQPVDRQSAFELLRQRAEREVSEAADTRSARPAAGGRQRQSIGEAMLKSVARSVGSSLGRQLVRGLLGSLLGGRRR